MHFVDIFGILVKLRNFYFKNGIALQGAFHNFLNLKYIYDKITKKFFIYFDLRFSRALRNCVKISKGWGESVAWGGGGLMFENSSKVQQIWYNFSYRV